MRRFAEPSIIISILALAIAGLSLVLDFRTFSEANLPPQIFAKTNNYQISWEKDNSTSVSADFDVAVTNTSGETVSIVSCVIGVPNFEVVEGGYVGELLLPCGVFDSENHLDIFSGQTEFFSGSFETNNSNSPEFLLPRMGYSVEDVQVFAESNGCESQFSYKLRFAWSMYGCDRTLERVFFTIYLQTGKAESIAMAIPSSGTNNWPWRNLSTLGNE